MPAATPSDPPLVRSVVLNWNGWRDTLPCLRSLEELDYPRHRPLVVDNGSTDDSVARISAAFPGVELLETGRNLGFGGGCNAGIRHVMRDGCDYVWLLNNDTLVEPATLSALVAEAEADPRVGMVASVLRYHHHPEEVQAWGGGAVRWWLGLPRHLRTPEEARRLDYLVGASLLARTAMLREIGLFDEGFFLYWEDADLSLRARAAGWSLRVAEGSTVLHKEGGSASGGARTRSLSAEQFHLESLVRFMRKHRRAWPLTIATRAALETAHQLRTGRPERVVPLLRTLVRAVRGSAEREGGRG